MAFVQGTPAASSGSTPATTTAFGSTVTVGNKIIVAIAYDGGGTGLTSGVTDNKGNTYQRANAGLQLSHSGTTLTLDVWFTVVTAGGTGLTVAVAFNDAATNAAVIAQEHSGNTVVDKFAIAQGGSSTAPSSGATAATTDAAEDVIGIAAHGGAISAYTLGAGYTNLGQNSVANAQLGMESKVIAASAAQTAAFTIAAARFWIAAVVTFRSAGNALGVPFISNANTMFTPTAVPGPVTVAPPYINNANSMFSPAVAYKIATPFISNANTLFAPLVAPGPVTLLLPRITNTNSMFTPVAVPGPVTLQLPFITSVSIAYSPRSTKGQGPWRPRAAPPNSGWTPAIPTTTHWTPRN